MNNADIWFDPSLCFIGNEWLPSGSGKTIELTDPSIGQPICIIAQGRRTILIARCCRRRPLWMGWGRLTAPERGRLMFRLGQLVLDNTDRLARLEAMDVGKPYKQAKADVLALARYMEFLWWSC